MKLLTSFDVIGMDAVPWSVPDIGVAGRGGKRVRFAKKNERLEAWQAYVRHAAETARAGAPPWLGPISIAATFTRKTPVGRRHGELWCIGVQWDDAKGAYVKHGKSTADLTNLFKGTEDAIESVFYADDVQTCLIRVAREYGPHDGVRVTVYAIEPGDFPGVSEPVGA